MQCTYSSIEFINGFNLLVAFAGFSNLHELARSASGRYKLIRKHPLASTIRTFAMLSWASDLTVFTSHTGSHNYCDVHSSLSTSFSGIYTTPRAPPPNSKVPPPPRPGSRRSPDPLKIFLVCCRVV